jgi:probable addiction module antidote protein
MTEESAKLLPFDMVALLDSDEAILKYLSQVLANNDRNEIGRALGYIAKAKGVIII